MEIECSSIINYNTNRIEVKHLENLVNKLIDCYQTGKFCDVTLIAGVDKRRIPAHRLMLSAANSYFDAMFTNNLKEKDEIEIVLKEVHGVELKMLIDFCYTGYISVSQIKSVQLKADFAWKMSKEYTALWIFKMDTVKLFLNSVKVLALKHIFSRTPCHQ